LIKREEPYNVYRQNELEHLLKARKLFLTKERGQNFLLSEPILQQISDLIQPGFPLLEIGPGLGHLSRFLLPSHTNYYAVELDKGFFEYLEHTFGQEIKLFHRDFLKFNLQEVPEQKIIVVGNIPYSLSLPILLHLFRNLSRLEEIYLLVQEEFALKLLAQPSSENYGRISVITQYYSTPAILLKVPSYHFFPSPKVNSVFIKLSELKKFYDRGFEDFVTRLFSARRKTLNNNLKSYATAPQIEAIFQNFSLDKTIRAEALPALTLFKIYDQLKKL